MNVLAETIGSSVVAAVPESKLKFLDWLASRPIRAKNVGPPCSATTGPP
jgi:hypothetical protein